MGVKFAGKLSLRAFFLFFIFTASGQEEEEDELY